jgi:hypothetical protein
MICASTLAIVRYQRQRSTREPPRRGTRLGPEGESAATPQAAGAIESEVRCTHERFFVTLVPLRVGRGVMGGYLWVLGLYFITGFDFTTYSTKDWLQVAAAVLGIFGSTFGGI